MSGCPNCGASRKARHRFCWNCGARLDASRELKQVTVLLADLCGSTEQVTRTDAEGGQAYLDEALRLMSEAVAAYGGTQVQWRGDELLALFGAPVAQEDHAVRACLAAIAMLEATKGHHTPQTPMAVRIGIDSGEVIAGPGSGDLATSYRVDGAPVHLASRLEKLAPPASAYLSGNTLQLVGERFEVKALGPHTLRGFNAPIDIHELLGGAQPGSAAAPLASRRYLGPLVGRAELIETLTTLAATARTGRLYAAGIRGDAGIGKSRLLAEVSAALAQQGFLAVSVTARSYASQAPYSLVADIVRALHAAAGDGPRPAPETQPAGDAALQAAALADLLGSGDPGNAWRALNPPQRREHIANAFLALVHACSDQQPMVLLVEDVFLADASSVRLLESLPRRLQAQPLLLLMSYRPDFTHRWHEAPWFVEHHVGPLAPDALSQLADELLGRDDALKETRAALLERAGGNPLFLEQLVMTLVDDGSLLGAPGAYRRATTSTPLRVPASIMTLIGARVDRLPHAAKASLEAAAILGEPLSAELVAAVRNISRTAAERHLRHAMSGGLIAMAPSPTSGAYAFRHGLVQESLVATLTRTRRRHLHSAAFKAYEAHPEGGYAATSAAVLAHHAYHGEHWLAAAEHAQRAMARSIERSENKDALRMFELGLDAAGRVEADTAQLPCELSLRLEALGAQMALGQFDAIVANLERAEGITVALGDARRQAGVSLQLAVTLWARGSYPKGLSVADHAGQAAAAAGSRSLQMAALQARMMLNHGLGRYAAAARDAFEVSEEFAAELQARRLFPGWAVMASTNLHAFIADIMTFRGDLHAAQAACEAGYAELEEQDHPFSRTLLDFARAELLLAQQRPAEAAALLRGALELCRAHEVSNMYPAVLAHLGGALALSGRADEALALLEPAVASKLSLTGGRYNEYYFPYFHAIALQEAGRIDEALAAARRACDAAASFQQHGHQARALLLLARLEERAGRQRDALAHQAEAEALAASCGMDHFLDTATSLDHA